jgi:hypothetical protein
LANLPVGRQVCPKIPPLFLEEGGRGSLEAPSFNSPGPSFKKKMGVMEISLSRRWGGIKVQKMPNSRMILGQGFLSLKE